MAVLLPNVVLPADEQGYGEVIAELLGVTLTRVTSWRLVRRSLDARQRQQVWRGVFRVEVDGEAELLASRPDLRVWRDKDEDRYGVSEVGTAPARVRWPAEQRVIVVGAGPAGLFAALWLAEAGVPVLLLERGGPVKERVDEVNGFWRRKHALDPDHNLVFGEGGAGTFSDGKIYTRRRDGEVGYVLRRFVDFGARSDILEEGWAHLGTDKVRGLLPVFRERLRELGAEVRFSARVDDLLVERGRAVGVRLRDGAEERGVAVLMAPGHSARDTVRMLLRHGAAAVARPIAIGARIEHPQAVIDEARYRRAERGELPPASYRLAHNPDDGPKARTFCMCPGGMVVPAMSEAGQVVVNGMSFAAQRAYWANSAVIVEVEPSSYASGAPDAGYAWQDEIERRAFDAGGGTYAAPAQRVVDLLAGRASVELPRVSYPLGVQAARLDEVLPGEVMAGMVAALKAFDRKLAGFVGEHAVLIAPETRTTSPVRLLRDAGFASPTLPGLYPVGEGAGYGGGIVSCAIDGIRAARALVASRDQKAETPTPVA